MLKNDYARPFVVSMAVSLFVASAASAIPTNGDFSIPGLFGWTVESGTVTGVGGYAFFEEDPVSLMSSLVQEFTIPDGALELSFELKMEVKGVPDSDAFTASLLDAATLDPLISYAPDVTWYYYLEHPAVEPMTVATWEDIGNDWMRVTLDVSSPLFIGQDVLLAFDLYSIDDIVTTAVSLDNVIVSTSGLPVIPAPGALLLGLIGSGLVGLLRRSRHGL